MGYYATLEDAHLQILPADRDDAFRAAMTTLADSPRWDSEDYATCEDVGDILARAFDDVIDTDVGFTFQYSEKYGADWIDVPLEALAPFVVEGALQWRGEDGEVWLHRFWQGALHESAGNIVFPDDPMPDAARDGLMLLVEKADRLALEGSNDAEISALRDVVDVALALMGLDTQRKAVA